jgi:hypothetical protein
MEIANAVEGLLGDRRAIGGMDVEEFAADMGPAGGLGDPVAVVQPIEPGIAVGVDDPLEALQMRLWVLALAVGRIAEQGRRWARTGERALVANVGPQPAGLGFARARRQYRHRGVVDVECVAGDDIGRQRVDQGLECCRRRADPAGQGRGFQADALAGEDFALPVERQVIVVLRDDDMRQQSRPGPAAGDRVVRRRRRDDRVAGPAGQLLAHVPDHLEAAGHNVTVLHRTPPRSGSRHLYLGTAMPSGASTPSLTPAPHNSARRPPSADRPLHPGRSGFAQIRHCGRGAVAANGKSGLARSRPGAPLRQ